MAAEAQGSSQSGPSPRADASQPGSPGDKPAGPGVAAAASRVGSSGDPAASKPPAAPALSRQESVKNVAFKIASEPLQDPDPSVWGVLTAINTKARERKQGLNMYLNANVHYIGRLVKDVLFRIDSGMVSGEHCRIFKEGTSRVVLKDTSSNGTFVNWTKLGKNSAEVEIHHGDIISFVGAPHSDHAFAFVFREVVKSTPATDDKVTKRKANELAPQKKRLKGIGLGAPEGPISLDDFRSLQRSNTELREQLEKQVLTIDALNNENRASAEHHEKEIKVLKESISNSYLQQMKDLKDMLNGKQNELVELSKLSAEQKQVIEDLNARLRASVQSCREADEIMKSQKASIVELKSRLEEERDLRREEREKATADLKEAVQRAHSEAQAELKRWSDAALRREKEQQEVLDKLQELEKERCALLENMRCKLEDARHNLVISENKVRQLEAQIHEEQQVSAKGRNKVEELEQELRRLTKDLENEKAAREEACARVSTLELEISAAIRDLDYERRRLKAARERIMLRETQLRAFYSTTEEISALFSKQQEQLKAMQRTLEDEENYENASVDIDLNVPYDDATNNPVDAETVERNTQERAKATSVTSAPRFDVNQVVSSSDEASATEGHECDIRTEQEGQNTQEVEFMNGDHNAKGGFGSDIDVVTGTVPEGEAMETEQVREVVETEREADAIGTEQDRVPIGTEQGGDPIGTERGDLIGTEQAGEQVGTEQEDPIGTEMEGDHVGTEKGDQYGAERVLETESQRNSSEQNMRLNDDSIAVRDTMELDDGGDSHSQENTNHFQSKISAQALKDAEDTEADIGDSIRTGDLLASEVAGSWACSTAPSAHGENESPRSRTEKDDVSPPPNNFIGTVAESQSNPSPEAAVIKQNREHRALTKMIGIVAPDLKKKFSGSMGCDSDREGETRGSASDSGGDSETESDDGDGDGKKNDHGGSDSDAETEGSNRADVGDRLSEDPMDEDNEATQADSFG
ncbi:golgin subfamily A member 6-like protein 2 isoform X2 [Punica granatum]|uniref:Golgin subfamily A member 6-like protein 2 isoform X2 n=2 Tax=Punica granatum TaxID=22663 RepID=A0A218VX21_PUNGR|nr:golgin subfamily A member 6-like protein 2 isoform X2 [Punica granatum]OWM64956.1 hypothetical protein CDL15_Pgr028674 [Punica granatum]